MEVPKLIAQMRQAMADRDVCAVRDQRAFQIRSTRGEEGRADHPLAVCSSPGSRANEKLGGRGSSADLNFPFADDPLGAQKIKHYGVDCG
jgi:hypothetical protein